MPTPAPCHTPNAPERTVASRTDKHFRTGSLVVRNLHLHHIIADHRGAEHYADRRRGTKHGLASSLGAAAERADAIAMPFWQNDVDELVAKNLTRDPPTRRK